MKMNDTTWMWDETTKLGQYRRYQSRGSPGEYRLRRKRKVKKMSFELFEKKRGRQIRYRWVESRCRRSEMMRELTKIRREIIPQDRSTVRERSVWNSETRSISGTIKGDKRWGASRTIWCEWKKRTEIRRVTSLKRFVCERENFVLNSLIYLEPVKRF